MKHLSVVLMLSVLVSCGGSVSSSHKGIEGNRYTPSCGATSMQLLCISPREFILNTRLSHVPDKMLITATYEFQGKSSTEVVIDTCKTPGSVEIVSNRTGSSIFFKSLSLYEVDSIIEISDLGADCKGNVSILKADVKKADMREERTSTAVVISIDLD